MKVKHLCQAGKLFSCGNRLHCRTYMPTCWRLGPKTVVQLGVEPLGGWITLHYLFSGCHEPVRILLSPASIMTFCSSLGQSNKDKIPRTEELSETMSWNKPFILTSCLSQAFCNSGTKITLGANYQWNTSDLKMWTKGWEYCSVVLLG